jgi:hypothetical protein
MTRIGTPKAGALFPAMLLAASCMGGAALAEDRLPSNRRLPSLDEVRPLPGLASPPLIYDVRINVETGYSQARNVGQPTELDQQSLQTTLGLSANVSQYAFVGISGTWSHETISSTNLAFGLPMAATANVIGADAVIGFRPLPFLSFGALGGYGSGSASYQFVGFPWPATPGDSRTQRLGGFVAGHYATSRWLLTGTATVIDIRTSQDYGPSNIPQYDSYGATLLLASLNGSYLTTDRITLSLGATLNQVLSEVVPSAQTGLDGTWLTLQAGIDYRLTDKIDLSAKAATWIGNDRMSYRRISLGSSYRF